MIVFTFLSWKQLNRKLLDSFHTTIWNFPVIYTALLKDRNRKIVFDFSQLEVHFDMIRLKFSIRDVDMLVV